MSLLSQRHQVMELVGQAITAGARQERACGAISLSERTLQRWQRDPSRGDQRPTRVQAPKNRLSGLERQALLVVANSDEFGHLSPSQIVPRLANAGQYVASESTFYRVLRAECQLQHRRAERPKQQRSKPRALCATAPISCSVKTSRIYRLGSSASIFTFTCFWIFLAEKTVGWQVYETESSELASEVMRDICAREHITPAQLVLHSDNGSPMKGATMLAALQSLGVIPSFSRLAVSNDNPYSESLFKTLKYRSDYPKRAFENLFAARQWVSTFMHWYNHEHGHSAIRFVTPHERHAGQDSALRVKRMDVYEAAKAKHPQHWSGPTRNWQQVREVHLNPEQRVVDAKEGQPATQKNRLN